MSRAITLALLCFGAAASAQSPASRDDSEKQDTLSIGGALLRAKGTTTVGVQWVAAKALKGDYKGDDFPRRLHGDARTTGTLALDAKANRETITASLDGGAFVSLYKAGEFGGDDPNAPTTGGFNLGSARLMLRGAAEGQQGNRAINVNGGGLLRYSRSQRVWPIIPSFDVAYEVIHAVETDPAVASVQDDHQRLDIGGFWAIPMPGVSQINVFADLRHWRLQGAATTTLTSGTYGRAALAWVNVIKLGVVDIPSVFVRWSGGAQPLDQREIKVWTVGIVAYRAESK